MSLTLYDVAQVDGVPINGVTVDAWLASRFSAAPAENAAPPAGSPDAGPVTSGPAYGGEGAFRITVSSAADYYIRAQYQGAVSWAGPYSLASGGGSGLPSSPTNNSRLWIPGGGSAAWTDERNEDAAGRLVNATSTGDAGGRATHFMGTALPSGWSQTAHAPGSQVVGNSVLSVVTAGGTAQHTDYSTPYTPTGAFTVECRARVGVSTSSSERYLKLWVGTANLTNTGSWAMMSCGSVSASTGQPNFAMATSSANGTAATDNAIGFGQWFYLRLHYDGAGTWTGFYSPDRTLWLTAVTASLSLTFTPAYAGFSIGEATQYAAIDFFDVTA
jgi:hypothetical protein